MLLITDIERNGVIKTFVRSGEISRNVMFYFYVYWIKGNRLIRRVFTFNSRAKAGVFLGGGIYASLNVMTPFFS